MASGLPYPVPFWRASGAGNDFLALVEPGEGGEAAPGHPEPSPGQVRSWCRRGVGLGADGVFVLRRGGAGTTSTVVAPEPGALPPSDPRASGDRRHTGVLPVVTMTHFNADGSRADLCVNGTRCAARLAFELGWAADRVEVRTGAGPVLAHRAGDDRITLELPAPEPPEELPVEVDGTVHAGWSAPVGVPHYVLVWPGAMVDAPVAGLGRTLRSHPTLGTEGANVDFVRFPAADRVEIRTFERGVEGETLACGSGVLAAVAVGRRAGALELPVRVETAGGFEMEVGAGGAGRWTLTSDARLVARGEILPGAGSIPSPPGWAPAGA